MTIVEQAIEKVPGFDAFFQKFMRRMSINDRALSTSRSYGRSLAALSLHHNRLPTSLSLEEVEEYLYHVKQKFPCASDNTFKFVICALRFVFRMEGMDELRLCLPVIKQSNKLPVVLSKEEIVSMINNSGLLKQRVLISLLYGCGLRCGEVRNIQVMDVDLQRSVLHVRQGKGKKDRYLPLGSALTTILKKYISIQKPKQWLFTGKRYTDGIKFSMDMEKSYGQRSIQWTIKQAAKQAGILKQVNVHSLRHTYATHLLEDGVNILTIKDLLGHSCISTTMIYLHVAQINNIQQRSPLDTLHGLDVIGALQGELKFN